MFEAGLQESVDHTSGASGAARRSPYDCHPSQVHIYTRREVAAEKGIVEAIPALAYHLAIRVLLSNF